MDDKFGVFHKKISPGLDYKKIIKKTMSFEEIEDNINI